MIEEEIKKLMEKDMPEGIDLYKAGKPTSQLFPRENLKNNLITKAVKNEIVTG